VHTLPPPSIEIEATSGSPEDYDDRNGYLPDFLGGGSKFLVAMPLPKDKSDLVQVERAPKERPFELSFSVIMILIVDAAFFSRSPSSALPP
jgi:hypothetical protein